MSGSNQTGTTLAELLKAADRARQATPAIAEIEAQWLAAKAARRLPDKNTTGE